MNRNEVITLLQLQGGGQLVQVAFWQADGSKSKDYTYKNLTVRDLKVGELVVCEVYDRMSVATVTAIGKIPNANAIEYERLRHVAARVDLSALNRIRAAEDELADKIVKAEINEALTRALGGLSASSLMTPALLGKTEPAFTGYQDTATPDDEVIDDSVEYTSLKTGKRHVIPTDDLPYNEEETE